MNVEEIRKEVWISQKNKRKENSETHQIKLNMNELYLNMTKRKQLMKKRQKLNTKQKEHTDWRKNFRMKDLDVNAVKNEVVKQSIFENWSKNKWFNKFRINYRCVMIRHTKKVWYIKIFAKRLFMQEIF